MNRSIEFTFKKPPTPKKRKAIKLTEENYSADIGEILEKGYFPDINEMRQLNHELDADETSLNEPLVERDSPSTFQTPSFSPTRTLEEQELIRWRLARTVKKVKEEGIEMPKMTLDEFVARYTTEDDESFQKILQLSGGKVKKAYSCKYNDEEALNSIIAKRLEVPSIDEQAQGVDRPLAVDAWGYKNENDLMFAPQGIANQPNSYAGRIINSKNTRLHESPFDQKIPDSQLQQAKVNYVRSQRGKIGIDGKNTIDNVMAGDRCYVRTPSPMPGVASSPLMTWGEQKKTPFRLDGGSTPSFHMQGTPKREQIALALADRATESHRDVKRKAAAAARPPQSPPSSRHQCRYLTPAAQRVAQKIIGPFPGSSPTPARIPVRRRTSEPTHVAVPVATPSSIRLNAAPTSSTAPKRVLLVPVKQRKTKDGD